MLIEAILTFLITQFNNFLLIFAFPFFEMIQFPASYVSVFFDFVNVAFWFLPTSVLPIFVFVPLVWSFRIIVASFDGLLGLISRVPIIKHI